MRSLFFPIPKQEASGALFNDGSLSVSLLADLALASQPEVGSAVSGFFKAAAIAANKFLVCLLLQPLQPVHCLCSWLI